MTVTTRKSRGYVYSRKLELAMRAKRKGEPTVVEAEMMELTCCVCKRNKIRVLKQKVKPEFRCSHGCGRSHPWERYVGDSAPKRGIETLQRKEL